MDLVSSMDVLGAALGQPEIPDLAFLDEVGHGLDCVLNGNLGIRAMLVV